MKTQKLVIDILANKLETFAPLDRRQAVDGFMGFIARAREEHDLRLLWVPVVVFVLTSVYTIGAYDTDFSTPTLKAQVSQLKNSTTYDSASLSLSSDLETHISQRQDSAPVFERRDSFLKDLSLEKIRKAASALVNGEEQATTQTAVISEQELLSQKASQITFLGGMIAQFRPTIPDCGAVARFIVQTAHKKQIDPFFVAAVISVESRFTEDARSKVGAMGLMQLMPGTAREVASNSIGNSVIPSLTDAKTNIELGIDYLKFLEQKYNGNRFLMLTAYNWGPGNIDNALQTKQSIPRSVKDYAKTIIERTDRWHQHFQSTSEHVATLE